MHEISWPMSSEEEIAKSAARVAAYYPEEELIKATFLRNISEYLAFFRRLQETLASLGPCDAHGLFLEASDRFDTEIETFSGMMRLVQWYTVAGRALRAEAGFLCAWDTTHWCALYAAREDGTRQSSSPSTHIFREYVPEAGLMMIVLNHHVQEIRRALRGETNECSRVRRCMRYPGL